LNGAPLSRSGAKDINDAGLKNTMFRYSRALAAPLQKPPHGCGHNAPESTEHKDRHFGIEYSAPENPADAACSEHGGGRN
jgi:hypothetical protein